MAVAAAEFTRVLKLTMPWNGTLDASNDFLRCGFGIPNEGFVLIWRQANIRRLRSRPRSQQSNRSYTFFTPPWKYRPSRISGGSIA